MTFPRSSLVDDSRASSYHLVSRCVRRAFLCGDAAAHRRQWVADAIRLHSTAFCIDVLAYAVMANHLHIVVTTQPDRAAALSPLAVAERWAVLFPARDEHGNPLPPSLCVPYSENTAKLCPGPLSLDDYLTLVDETGRFIRSGKRGAIPAHLAPILARLDLDIDTWLSTMLSPSRFLGAAIGSAAARAAEAVRRGVKWVVDRTRIHKPPPAA